MRLIDADKMRENLLWCKEQSSQYDDYWDDVIERLDAQPTITFADLVDKRAREMERKKLERWLEDHQNEQR